MPRIKTIPAAIVLAGVLGAFNPLYAADSDDQATALPEAVGLPGVDPVGVDQEPRGVLAGKVGNDRVQDGAFPWWIGDEACDVADQSSAGILASDLGGARLDVPCGGTDVTFTLKIPR